MKLLLIEDNPDHAELFKYQIETALAEGYTIDWQETLSSGLQKLAQSDYDFLFLDLSLPDSSLQDTLKEAQAHNSNNVPIVAMSSLDESDFGAKALANGAEMYLSKGSLQTDAFLKIFSKNGNVQIVPPPKPPPQTLLEKWDPVINKIVHDLKAPIRNISALSAFHQEDYAGKVPSEIEEYIASNIQNCEQLSKLINALKTILKTELTIPRMVDVDLNKILKKAQESLEDTSASNALKIVVDNLPSVPGDPELLAIVFQELLDNAQKFRSEKEPLVKIIALESEEQLSLTFQDNGIGLKNKERSAEIIFNVFHQMEPHGKTSGTGKGLYLCRTIINKLNGSIAVDKDFNDGFAIKITLQKKQ